MSKRGSRFFLLALALLCTGVLLAQSSGGDFEITRSSIDSGGGPSAGGEFELTGTIAQPDANLQVSSGSGYLLAGGFWAQTLNDIFTDGFEGSPQP